MSQGLNVQRVVRVTVTLAAAAATYRNFGSMLVMGSTPNVIDINERKRDYADVEGVASDFGTTAPEYLFAQEFFSQVPQPSILSVGRWAQNATNGLLHGAILTPSQRLITTFQAITAGAFKISLDGTAYALSGLDFSAQTNLNGVASVIQAALVAAGAAGATVKWNGVLFRFEITSGTTGATSLVSYATAPVTGTDVSVILGLSATPNATGAAAHAPIGGLVPETALAAAELMGDMFGDWYALAWAPVTPLADSDALAVAGYVQAAGQSRIQCLTTLNTTALDATQTTDLCALLEAAGYGRSLVMFSETNPYAVASLFARFATVNYLGSNTTITGKFKILPGVIPEILTESQAETLAAKNYNVYAAYQNSTAITQEGVMADGTFIDSRINADWLANYVQTNVYNFLRIAPKVPQTNAGMAQIENNIVQSMFQAVTNGYIAPGKWNSTGFGTLSYGDMLPTGFYIYVPSVDTQSETTRQQRIAVPIQIAAKEAGAVHHSDIAITVNP